MAATAAAPGAPTPGQRSGRQTLRLNIPRKECASKELLLRAIVPRGQDHHAHVDRLRSSITPFCEELKAAAVGDLPDHPIRVRRGVASYSYTRRGEGQVHVLIARLVICSELVPSVKNLLTLDTISIPAPYDGLMEARWDGAEAEEKALILDIPSAVTVDELTEGLAGLGFPVRDLHMERDLTGLMRSDTAIGYFPAGRAPCSIELVGYGVTLRVHVKSQMPIAPSIRRGAGPPPNRAAPPQSYSGALAASEFPPLSEAATSRPRAGSAVRQPPGRPGGAGVVLTTVAAASPERPAESSHGLAALSVPGDAAQETPATGAGADESPPGHAAHADAAVRPSSVATPPAQPVSGDHPAISVQGPQIAHTPVVGASTIGGSTRTTADVRMADGIRPLPPSDHDVEHPAKRTRSQLRQSVAPQAENGRAGATANPHPNHATQ